jgi:ABC-type lipoprotein export system ATPase subunit
MRAPLLETRALSRTLGQVPQPVLRAIDLSVERGDFVALTGESGSGKSTLLYLLGALDRPTGGAVLFDGVDLGGLNDDARARLRNEQIGFVFQFHFLLPELDVLENVALPLWRRGVADGDARAIAARTLERLGLGRLQKRWPHELSGGQQQRVSIARAVAGQPAVVLADEPTGNLDSSNAEEVMQLFTRLHRDEGVTFVVVTHSTDFAARMCRRIALRDGQIVSDSAASRVPWDAA